MPPFASLTRSVHTPSRVYGQSTTIDSRQLDVTTYRVTAVCFLLSLALGLSSNAGHHDDDLTHYLMARWAWWHPEYLLHLWGRPGFTLPMAAVAWIGDRFTGWHAARILSACVSAAAALIASQLAARLGGRRPWLVALLCYAQPLYFVLSYTTLTENWTALYLIAAVSLLMHGRPCTASLVFSLALVSRHEAVIFVPLWWTAIALRPGAIPRKMVIALMGLWAPILHNLLFKAAFGEWPARMYLLPHGSTQYLPAGALAYLPHVLYAVTPVILVLACLAAPGFLKRDHWLLVAIPALFLVTHTVIKTLGLFASGGYGRFMVAVSPFLALMAAAGIERLRLIELRKRALVALAALVAIQLVIMARPLRERPEHRVCADVADWLRLHHPADPLFITHPWIVYHRGLVESPRVHKGLQTLASMPEGTIIVWDNCYSESDYHGLSEQRLRDDLQARPLKTFRVADHEAAFRVVVSRKDAAPQVLSNVLPAYPPEWMTLSRERSDPLYQFEN